MFLTLKRFFTAPVFEGDEEKTRTAQHLYSLLWVTLVAGPTAAILFYFISPSSLLRVFVIIIPIPLIFLLAAALARHGWVSAGSIAVVMVAWIATILNSILSGGLKSPGFGTGSLLVILLAGLLLGRRGAFAAILLNLLFGLILIWGESQTWMPPPPSAVNSLSILASYVLNVIVAGSLVYATIRSIQFSLDRARGEIRERERVETDLERRADEVGLLYQLGLSLASGRDLRSTLLALQSEIARLIQADAFLVAIYEPARDAVSFPIFFERGRLVYPPERLLHEDPGFSGPVILKNQILYLPDMTLPEVEQAYHPYHTGGLALHTFLGIPLTVKDRVIGMLSVQSEGIDAYSPAQIRLMETISVQAALAIDKARMLDRLQQELAERQRMEQSLAASEKRFYQAFHASPVMMTIEGPDHRFADVNQAFMDATGFSRGEILGQRASEIQLIATEADRRILDESAREHKPIKNQELHFRRKSGKSGMALLSSDSFEVNGAVYELTSALDITERKSAEAEREKLIAELKTKNIELEEFTYVVSHDLRAPLITVKGFLGLLERDLAGGDEKRVGEDVKRISDAMDKMNRLLNELLELSRLGLLINAPQTLSFESLITDALQNVRGRLDARGVPVQIQSNLPAVSGDRQRLVEVLQNLIENAAKFMGDQTHPAIEIGQRGEERGMPVFFVKDNGIGIAPAYHEKIFGLFNKLDGGSDSTGVGLAIVKRIIEAHGGRIWVESQVGEGATFCFTIPGGTTNDPPLKA